MLSFFRGFSQDPGHAIFIEITNNEKKIADDELNKYHFTLFGVYSNEQKIKLYINNQFLYTGWGILKYPTVYEIKTIHNADTMVVRFQLNASFFNEQNVWKQEIYFEIPFQAGYFEITDFINNGSEMELILSVKNDYQWTSLPPEKRKLVIR